MRTRIPPPTEAERDGLIALGGDYIFDEVASVFLAVKPEDLRDAEKEAGR